ncbi:MAG: ECF transporter S component [Clostridiales bacterium]|nr:ECF transporter S component [Clostridiales bacterium]
MKVSVNQMVKMGVLAALSIVLMMVIRFPIIPGVTFLEYEPADVPILIGAFLFGPLPGLAITVVVSVIQALTVSAGSGWIGAMMHVIATGAFVMVAGTIYKKVHSLKGAIIGLAAGTLTMTAVMIPLNLLVTPLFLGYPIEDVIKLLVPAIIPFNLLKGIINSTLTALVYKSVGKVLRIEKKVSAV